MNLFINCSSAGGITGGGVVGSAMARGVTSRSEAVTVCPAVTVTCSGKEGCWPTPEATSVYDPGASPESVYEPPGPVAALATTNPFASVAVTTSPDNGVPPLRTRPCTTVVEVLIPTLNTCSPWFTVTP